MIEDSDRDGSVSVDFQEFVELMIKREAEKEMPEDLIRVFDKDGNGFVSTSEIKYVLSRIGVNFSDDELLEMVQEADEPVLKKLQDITVTFSENPMGFTLHFYFAPNDYFTNSVLTKEYEMKCEPSEDDPFSFEGPEIFKCKGSTINWKEGKNLTVKTVKKKQKHKSKGNVRTITKQVKNDSFFNFFDPPPIPDDPDADVDPETQDLLTADFEIGHYIRDRIIPRAVLFFTGEALEEEDFDEEEEEDEEGEEGEEEEDDPDFDPAKAKPGQQECKQQ